MRSGEERNRLERRIEGEEEERTGVEETKERRGVGMRLKKRGRPAKTAGDKQRGEECG